MYESDEEIDLRNDETFGNEIEDEKNDETFGEDLESSDLWESMEEKTKEFDKFKSPQKEYDFFGFQNQPINQIFKSLQIEDEDEEEEFIVAPKQQPLEQFKREESNPMTITPKKQNPNQTNFSPLKYGVHSPGTGLIFPGTSPLKNEEQTFKNSKRMLSTEIEFIVKQQLSGLEMTDPYMEDYYYCAKTSKQVSGKKTFPPQSIANSLSKTEKKEEEIINHLRIFGRVAQHNTKAPRTVIELTEKIYSTNSSLSKDEKFKVLKLIDKGTDILDKIEDLVLCEKESPKLWNNWMGKTLETLCEELLKVFKGNLKEITSRERGKKLKEKSLTLLPLIYRHKLLSLQ